MDDCTVIDRVAVLRHTSTVRVIYFEAREIQLAARCSINPSMLQPMAENVSLSNRTGLTDTTCSKIKPEVCQHLALFFDRYGLTLSPC